MSLQNTICIPKEDLLTTYQEDNVQATYVMQGKASEKVLDIYHLILAPTNACNLHCRHCYLPNHNLDILSKDTVLRLVDEWNEIVKEERGQYGGIFHIKGGEPFMVPYLFDVIDRLSEIKSLRLMLTTNGTFVDEQVFRKLKNCNESLDGHVTVIVSLDGATEETNTKIRGKGHFDKVLKFLKGLRNHGINFYLNCVLHKDNIEELSAYIDLANKYGATQANFLNFIPKGRGSDLQNWQVPHLKLYEKLEEVYKSGNEQIKSKLAGCLPDIKYREAYEGCHPSQECVAGYRGLLYITPDGSVFSCPNTVYHDVCIGNILNHNLKEILNNVEDVYNKLKIYSGQYICTGEKMFYKRGKKFLYFIWLGILQNKLNQNKVVINKAILKDNYSFIYDLQMY